MHICQLLSIKILTKKPEFHSKLQIGCTQETEIGNLIKFVVFYIEMVTIYNGQVKIWRIRVYYWFITVVCPIWLRSVMG